MKAIVAVDKNFGIGYKNNLLFKIPEDQKFFKKITTRGIVIMGSNTYKSIGQALPNRSNIIITRDPKKYDNIHEVGAFTKEEFEKRIKLCDNTDDMYVIGGEQIYKLFYDYIDEIYITIYDKEFKNVDAYFINLYNDKTFIQKDTMGTGYYNDILWTITKWERIK